MIESRPEIAVVCGRRRERYIDQSIYNRLADLDWDLSLGPINHCGGDTMTRVEAFRQVGGFTPDLIAVEDIDLCVRFRQRGWTILRIDADMTLHDIAMKRFGQWWRRSIRTGFGYADGMRMHGKPPERLFVREIRSILLWGAALPLSILVLAWPTRVRSPFHAVISSCIGAFADTGPIGDGYLRMRLYARWCILGKFPMLIGLMRCWFDRIAHCPKQLIEYKDPERADPHGIPCSSTSGQ